MYSYEYIRPSEEYGEMKTLRSKDAVNGISICVSQESYTLANPKYEFDMFYFTAEETEWNPKDSGVRMNCQTNRTYKICW